MVFGLQPLPKPNVQALQIVDRFQAQSRLKIALHSPEKPFDLSPAPSSIRPGVDEFDFEISTANLQVSAGKDFALIGIELLRQAASSKGLFKAIKQTAELFIVVILAVRDQPGAVIEQGKKERMHGSIPYAQGGAVHDIGHPQCVG
jgi:hypothetical protein